MISLEIVTNICSKCLCFQCEKNGGEDEYQCYRCENCHYDFINEVGVEPTEKSILTECSGYYTK